MSTDKKSYNEFERIYYDQLTALAAHGRALSEIALLDAILYEFKTMKERVFRAYKELGGDYDLPFLPVFPKRNLILSKKIFTARYGGLNLQVKGDDYCDGDALEKPYYIIGIRTLTGCRQKKDSETYVNFSEILSLSIFSELTKQFYAHRGHYVVNEKNHLAQKSICADEQGNKLGIWLNATTGATGPFQKNGKYPTTVAAKKIILAS